MQQSGSGRLGVKAKAAASTVSCILRTHWHRVILDESHYNQSGQKTKAVLAQLSATHRHCVTGTPVGHSLKDLHGQLRFLRVAPFHRAASFEAMATLPFEEREPAALPVLDALLSRVVIRHTKDQQRQAVVAGPGGLGGRAGGALVSLPPRSVELLRLDFDTPQERRVYVLAVVG